MSAPDLVFVLKWYFVLFTIGIAFLPLANKIFPAFSDKGYSLSKILGLLLVSYVVFVLAMTRIVQFHILTISITIVAISITSIFLTIEKPLQHLFHRLKRFLSKYWGIFVFEEILFFISLYFLSYIRSFAPDIHGLEKYMDYGFINSILRSDFFPPQDMWFTPLSINYYYFGHLTTALLTKLSGIGPEITYNLMLATIFAMALTASFSIVLTFTSSLTHLLQKFRISIALLTAIILTLGGNLHTIYTFFTPYTNESPVAPWELTFQPFEFPNAYWYPNATRFIYNTIHEFPMYSWTVSDLHGHVLDIPFVLLTIAVIYSFFLTFSKKHLLEKNQSYRVKMRFLFFIGLLLSVMYMTNAWDGIIYFLLVVLTITVMQWQIRHFHLLPFPKKLNAFFQNLRKTKSHLLINILLASGIEIGIVGIGFFFFSLPFSLAFKPFVSGIGILCAPEFLTEIGKIGPFLFESDHCQHSPLWQLAILHGFFYFFVALYAFILWRIKRLTQTDIFVCILIFLSTLLILIPEFIYAKDIYPGHYRANTMFKLVFQSYMMLSLSVGYILFRFCFLINTSKKKVSIFSIGTSIMTAGLLSIIFIYPFQSIYSYYGDLKTYRGLDGTNYLSTLYPDDYAAILWIQNNIKGQPVILEAQGDSYGGASSYTDYARVSANTGLPTVLGWTVHEWLWRGSYDIPAPRVEEIRIMYESEDVVEKIELLNKYNVSYIFVGSLEREKYPLLRRDQIELLGDEVFRSNDTAIYKRN